MSDNNTIIVPRISSYPNNKAQAKDILEWLITRNIVKSTLSDCVSSGLGYAIADQARYVTSYPEYLPFNLRPNGLEIITERQVFDAGSNGLDKLICFACGNNIASDNWDLNSWHKQESDNLRCPRCGAENDVHTYTFDPVWGFSNLGFRFWNWPDFTHQFISEFEQKLGCDISIVYQRI